MDPQAQLVCGGAEAQTKQALENLRHILEAGGASLESVVKTTILLANLNDFQVVNQVYAECRYPSQMFLKVVFSRYQGTLLIKRAKISQSTWANRRCTYVCNYISMYLFNKKNKFVRACKRLCFH